MPGEGTLATAQFQTQTLGRFAPYEKAPSGRRRGMILCGSTCRVYCLCGRVS